MHSNTQVKVSNDWVDLEQLQILSFYKGVIFKQNDKEMRNKKI